MAASSPAALRPIPFLIRNATTADLSVFICAEQAFRA
jgi:hypothetical protein